MNRVTSGIILMTFLSLEKAILIEGVFFMYAGITGMAWIFFFTLMPETQGNKLWHCLEPFISGDQHRESSRERRCLR